MSVLLDIHHSYSLRSCDEYPHFGLNLYSGLNVFWSEGLDYIIKWGTATEAAEWNVMYGRQQAQVVKVEVSIHSIDPVSSGEL